ncbi:MAG TPA: alpha/beta hydrolase fold domain-containing protein, partial [Kofleriaceae bacterium]
YMVVNISYRLAPQHPYPAALEDVCLAYRWLADNIEQLGGDPSRVALAGESAGGNLVTSLALMLAERRTEPFAQAVYDTGLHARAVMSFCAILEVSRPSRFAERRKIPRWVEGMMHDITASYLRGHELGPGSEAALELADPLRVIETHAAAHRSHPDVAGRFARQLPAFFAPVGTRDPLLDDTRRLARALDELGVPVEARYYPGGIHAFHAFVWDAVAQRCWRDALAFLDRHMR